MVKRLVRRVPDWGWMMLMILALMGVSAIGAYQRMDEPRYLVRPVDNDSWLRLTLVRDWLASGDWYHHAVERSSAPEGGITSPWTRPLDVLIAGLVGLQWDGAPIDTKLLRAALVLPILWAMLGMLGMVRAVRHMNGLSQSGFFMMALIGAMPPLWGYFGTGNADHHAPLCALYIWVAASMLRPSPREGWVAGALLGVMTWLSPEALILAGGIYAWLGLLYAVKGEGLLFLRRMTLGAAGMALLALVVERPPAAWLTPVYDSISIVQVTQLFVCALAAALIGRIPARLQTTAWQRAAGGGLVGGAMLFVLWLLYPLSFYGPYADVDPFIFTHFLPSVSEAKSPLNDHPFYVAGLFLHPMLALASCFLCLRGKGPIARSQALVLLMLIAVPFALCLYQQRWFYYLYPSVALALTPWIAALYEPEHPLVRGRLPALWVVGYSERARVAIRLSVLASLLLTPLLLFLLMPERMPETGAWARCEREAQLAIEHGALEKALGPGPRIVLAPSNVGAHLLFFTPYRIIASNYHREAKALRYMWEADTIEDAEAFRAHLARRQVDALILCPTGGKHYAYRLWAREESPAWLRDVDMGLDEKKRRRLRVMEVVR